jgi:hypothetical protein
MATVSSAGSSVHRPHPAGARLLARVALLRTPRGPGPPNPFRERALPCILWGLRASRGLLWRKEKVFYTSRRGPERGGGAGVGSVEVGAPDARTGARLTIGQEGRPCSSCCGTWRSCATSCASSGGAGSHPALGTGAVRAGGPAVIAVILEVRPAEGQTRRRLDLAAALRPEPEAARRPHPRRAVRSLAEPGEPLSLSFWRDEEASARGLAQPSPAPRRPGRGTRRRRPRPRDDGPRLERIAR